MRINTTCEKEMYGYTEVHIHGTCTCCMDVLKYMYMGFGLQHETIKKMMEQIKTALCLNTLLFREILTLNVKKCCYKFVHVGCSSYRFSISFQSRKNCVYYIGQFN